MNKDNRSNENLVREELDMNWINQKIYIASTAEAVERYLSLATNQIIIEVVLVDQNELNSEVLGIAIIIPNKIKVYIPLCDNRTSTISIEQDYIIKILKEKIEQLNVITSNSKELFFSLYCRFNINMLISWDTKFVDLLLECDCPNYSYSNQFISCYHSLIQQSFNSPNHVRSDDINAGLGDYKITKTYNKFSKQMELLNQMENKRSEHFSALHFADKNNKQDRKYQLIFSKYKDELRKLNIILDPLLYKSPLFDCVSFIDMNTRESVDITVIKNNEAEDLVFKIKDNENGEIILFNNEGNVIKAKENNKKDKKTENFREATEFEKYCISYLINNKELSYAIIQFNILQQYK